MLPDGTDVVQLTENEVDDVSPAWSPDTQRIAFERLGSADPELFTMDSSDGSGVSRLTRNDDVDASPGWQAK